MGNQKQILESCVSDYCLTPMKQHFQIVCSSIYVFSLPFWYIQTLLPTMSWSEQDTFRLDDDDEGGVFFVLDQHD